MTELKHHGVKGMKWVKDVYDFRNLNMRRRRR